MSEEEKEHRATGEELALRRNHVLFYKVKGLGPSEIVKQFAEKGEIVSLSTIEKDLQFLKEEYKTWIDDLAKDGLIHEWHLGLEKLKDTEREYNRMLNMKKPAKKGEEEKDNKNPEFVYDGEIRLHVLKLRDDNTLAKRQYLLDGPAVHIMKTHLEKSGGYDP